MVLITCFRDLIRNNIVKGLTSGIVFLALFAMFIFMSKDMVMAKVVNDSSLAPDCMDVRIGLVGLYGKKNVITIYNKAICIGFSRDNSYKAEMKLSSESGFSFEEFLGNFYMSNTSFKDYKTAKSFLKKVESTINSTAYICYYGKNSWRILVAANDYTGNSEELDKIIGNSSVLTMEGDSEFVKLSFGNKAIIFDGKGPNGYPQISVSGKKGISLGTRSYRGRIEIGRYGKGGVTAVNIVNAEAYLKGVITSEMSSSWPEEALKAQAVCSRSYLLANTGTGSDSDISKPYSLVDTDASQVYKGLSGESSAGIKAVNATYGVVIRAEGKILPAYYFSTSGGSTDFSADVWGGNSNHFVSVFDEYETNPERSPWYVRITYSELKDKLVNAGYNVGSISDIYVEITTDSERVSSVKIKHSKGSTSLTGAKLRNIMGINSTKFKIVTSKRPENEIYVINTNNKEKIGTDEVYCISGSGQISKIADQTTQLIAISDENMYNYNVLDLSDDEILILGMGWGHGIGMSQSGAYGMALKGFDYEKIVLYYFKNVDLVQIVF